MLAPQFTDFVSLGTSLRVPSSVPGGQQGDSALVVMDSLEGLRWSSAAILRETQAGWPH